MASKNQLLGHGGEQEEEVEEVKTTKSLKLYRHDCLEGRIFKPAMQEMMKRKGWTEGKVQPKKKGKSREELLDEREKELDEREKLLSKKEKEQSVFDSLLSDKTSKIDLSDKKTKKGEK